MSKVRIPKQNRSMLTKQRIMQAAFKLFAAKGIHGTNSKEIVEKAGLSVGSFYAYFKDKKALLLEMLDDYLTRHYQMIWQGVDLAEISILDRSKVRQILENVFHAYDISPEFHKQTHALRYSDPDIKKIFDRERKQEIDQIQSLLELNVGRLKVNDLYAAAIIIHNLVESVAHTAKFLGPRVDEDSLLDELTLNILGYLFGGS